MSEPRCPLCGFTEYPGLVGTATHSDCLPQKHWPAVQAKLDELERCKAELAAVNEDLADWQETARVCAGEMCGDEKHCTCVGPLRKLVAKYEAAWQRIQSGAVSNSIMEDITKLGFTRGELLECRAAIQVHLMIALTGDTQAEPRPAETHDIAKLAEPGDDGIDAIWLRSDGGNIIVSVESNGRWVEVIREHRDGPMSHIVERAGIDKALGVELKGN